MFASCDAGGTRSGSWKSLPNAGLSPMLQKPLGVTVANVEWWDSQDTYGFKNRKTWAAQIALGEAEKEIRRRAIEGVDRPIIYQGQITGTYKEYSDNLLMFITKKLDPSYRDNYQPQQGGTTINITQTVIRSHRLPQPGGR
jgi:hypothetical protein